MGRLIPAGTGAAAYRGLKAAVAGQSKGLAQHTESEAASR
jgi:hypothetical protein